MCDESFTIPDRGSTLKGPLYVLHNVNVCVHFCNCLKMFAVSYIRIFRDTDVNTSAIEHEIGRS